MIIECPACTTRYDIKAELPPDGRTVRCAKCGTVWRAMPDIGGEEVEDQEPPAVGQSLGTEETWDDGSQEETVHHEHFAASGHGEDREWPAHERSAAAYEETVTEEETSFKDGPEREFETDQSDPAEEDAGMGKVRWFSSFRRRKKTRQEGDAGEAAADVLAHATAETIPFPRSNFSVPQETTEIREEQRTLDAARHAVRSVFSSLGHGRPFASTAALSEDAQDRAHPDSAETQPENGWPESAETSGDPKRSGGEADDKGLSDVMHGLNGHGKMDATKEVDENNSDAALREAMRAHFKSTPRQPHFPPSPPAQEFSEKFETHFKSMASAPQQARPSSIAGLWGKAPQHVDKEMEPEPEGVDEPAEGRDDDTAFDQRLYREIEETQEKSGAPLLRGRRGGLALTAAWGLFLCVASGLIVGFFAFRDILADAAPGLAPLYRAFGMPVTVQPLVFESVQYEWSVSDNKPVLTVTGSISNRVRRKVRVPEFFIIIRDQDSALDREYSANLGITKIRSNQRSDFDIELVSPNPTITSVELELRNVR